LTETPYVLSAGGFDADAYVSWPVIVAQAKEFFAKEEIQLRLIRTDRAMMGLMAEALEIINVGASAALLAGEKGANLSMVYVLCDRPAEYMVLRKTVDHASRTRRGDYWGLSGPVDRTVVFEKTLAKKWLGLEQK
jgi:ABC-type nitrate/sulfonate/bicarbonate transport system substrate-binding protein